MGSYTFRPQVVPMIEDWSKRHTIRGERRYPDSPGNVMHLFTGLRHPGARCLMRAMCVRTEFIRIEGGPNRPHRIQVGFSLGLGSGAAFGEPIYGSERGGPLITLGADELQQLAWRAGFRPEGSSLAAPGDAFRLMMRFWDGRLPFEGSILHWNPGRQAVLDRHTRRWIWTALSGPTVGRMIDNEPYQSPENRQWLISGS